MSRRETLSNEPADPDLAGGLADAPPFAAPWQAQAFAMVVALRDKGLFTWPEWAAALSRELHRADAAADGQDYYERWLAALESLLIEKRMVTATGIDALAQAWLRAAHATPHGKAIVLENDPDCGFPA